MRSKLWILLLLMIAGCARGTHRPLQVPPEKYREMVSAFTTGTVALKVNDQRTADRELGRATQIVPEEPAAWANLALSRSGTANVAEASAALEKALSLAGPNSRLELLAGLLQSRQGNPQEAMKHLQRAITLDGSNLRARKALIHELERQGGPEAERAIKAQIEAILAAQPDNLWALLESTRVAAREGDAARLRERFEALKAHSAIWPARPKSYLAELEQAVAGGDARAAGTRVALLANVLKETPAYQQSIDTLGGNPVQAQPFEQFLRLPPPPATPAAPDMALAFEPDPTTLPRSEWARAAILAPAAPPEGEAPPQPDGPVEIVFAAQLPEGWEVRATSAGAAPVAIARGTGRLLPEQALLVDWNNPLAWESEADRRRFAYKPDLALAGPEGVRLIQQISPAQWRDVTAASRLPAEVLRGSYIGVWAIDYELDGDLDLVLGTTRGSPPVLQNNADGTWSVVRPFPHLDGLTRLAWADFDGDGDPDLAVRDGAGKLVLLQNDRLGFYRPWPAPEGIDGVLDFAVTDADRNGTLDLVVLSPDGAIRRVSYREGETPWEVAQIARWEEMNDETGQEGERARGRADTRIFAADLDNNGAVDLIASGGGQARVWLADAEGAWNPVGGPLDLTVHSVLDVNGNGRLDLVGIGAAGLPVRLLNRGEKSYAWTVVRPRSEPHVRTEGDRGGNTKINPFGIGGEAEIRAGLLAQKQPIEGPTVHFGLGEYPQADYVRLIWPNGQPQGEFAVKANQQFLAKQRLTGSCPWLFAHDGEAMKFVTDILWKSPLGLRINAQATAGAQTRDWVKVRGDQLAARDGFYEMSITAELWETNFFDHVSLMVIDHPEETEIWVDERFSVPQPPLEVIATGPVHPVTRAVDDRGRNVTEIVRERDGRYLDGFPLGRYQGIAADHFVEVDLPALGARPGVDRSTSALDTPAAGRLYLVGHGWVYPTDSSINVAISQGRHEAPRGLSLEAPDGKGGWVTVKSDLGFPAGKHKTVLIDLSDLPLPGVPPRLRLRTNMEIYWDAIGVAEGRPETLLKRQQIAPATADLRYRGFSVTHQPRRSTPEVPDYNVVAGTAQQWYDLVGFYTRFGDVRELLERVEDRYVIMNAGDEIYLRFPAPPPPPAGWKRDFIFVSDGWDKDGNLNTVYGQTVLPLPSHDWPEYDRPPGQLKEDPVYRRYPRDWEIFHTRYVTPRAFRRALWPGE